MDKLNILIIEDESLLAMELASKISSFGYHVVDYVTGTKSAMQILQTNRIDLILLDINLGEEKNGIAFYQSLGTAIPVIYLTAYKDEETISKAIKTYPLGYLTKPYKEVDLKALLKLAYYKKPLSPKEKEVIPLGKSCHFDTKERKLYCEDGYINLGEKELQLLELLISARGNFVTQKMIEDHLYSTQEVKSSTLRTLFYRLKKKLDHDLLENEFNHGFRLK